MIGLHQKKKLQDKTPQSAPSKFTTVIEAKLLKVDPGLQNRKIAFIHRDLVLHGLFH